MYISMCEKCTCFTKCVFKLVYNTSPSYCWLVHTFHQKSTMLNFHEFHQKLSEMFYGLYPNLLVSPEAKGMQVVMVNKCTQACWWQQGRWNYFEDLIWSSWNILENNYRINEVHPFEPKGRVTQQLVYFIRGWSCDP